MKFKHLFLLASISVLGACSTTPDVPEDTTTNQQTEIPVAQPVTPTPTEPIVDTTPETPVVTGPAPGTIDEFVYISGGEARVFFAYDQYDLSEDARSVLRRQAEWLNNYPNVMAVIEGNADERGTREYNLALAARRAESVKSFLVTQGVMPNRLTTVSYGKERPIDGRSTEAGWARNRNAHTNLLSGTIG